MIGAGLDELVYVVPRSLAVPGAGWLGIRTDEADSILAAITR